MIEVKKYKINKKWPKILFIWAIHWNEKCWTKAINKIINSIEEKEIKLLNWEISFVAIANPKAYKKNIRYIDINLNRVIKETKKPKLYEEKLANNITKIIKKNDIIVDLHSSHTDDEEFIFLDYQDIESKFLAESSWIKNIVTGWPDLYKNTWDSDTWKFSHDSSKISITVECGNHFKEKSNMVAENVIKNILSAYWIIETIKQKQVTKKQTINVKKYVKKKSEWVLTKQYQHLQKIKSWEILAEYKNWKKIIAAEDSYILLPFFDAKIWDEWFYIWI